MPDVFSITLNLGKGDCSNGFPSISLNAQSDRSTFQCVGSLPAPTNLLKLYQQWHQTYDALYEGFNLRRRQRRASKSISIDEDDITNISRDEFNSLCKRIGISINDWLNSTSFQVLSHQLHLCLSPETEARITIAAEDARVYQLPWHLWDLLDSYPLIEISFSPPSFSSKSRPVEKRGDQNRVLAIFGSSENLDVETDRLFIENLPNTDTSFLFQPSRKDFDNQLRDTKGWDILFFAGHSSSTRDLSAGAIEISPGRFLSIADLKHSLVAAIRDDLQLAIFNSCDGLGLARELASLNIPQLIVMRASVPDEVAQEFLKYLLEGLSSGQSFYLAEREARERLQGLEDDYPCASWLPVVFQNPAAPTIRWKGIKRNEDNRHQLVPPHKVALAALGASVLTFGASWFGLLEPMELQSYDLFMQMRPRVEKPDPRLLLVTVTDEDIRAQPNDERHFQSLSDTTLERLLETLLKANPRVIGLDLYRSRAVNPVQNAQLHSRWLNDNRLIGVCELANNNPDNAPPPDIASTEGDPSVLARRVGFSDLAMDVVGNQEVVRRQLVVDTPSSNCALSTSFNLLVAQRYLIEEGISLRFEPGLSTILELGDLRIDRHLLQGSDAGGYSTMLGPAGGITQLMLNYRASPAIAEEIPISEILNGSFDPQLVEDRIVLIGSVADSSMDWHYTPINPNYSQRMPGVVLQAHAISQLLSAVLDERPLIWWLPQWMENIWIVGTSILLGLGIARVKSTRTTIACVLISALSVWAIFFVVFFTLGAWLPFTPTVVSFLLAGSITHVFSKKVRVGFLSTKIVRFR